MDTILHSRFTTFNPSWYYTKWSSPSLAVATTVAQAIRAGIEHPIPNAVIHEESGPEKRRGKYHVLQQAP